MLFVPGGWSDKLLTWGEKEKQKFTPFLSSAVQVVARATIKIKVLHFVTAVVCYLGIGCKSSFLSDVHVIFIDRKNSALYS
jgi:hypothetical protein